MERIEECEDQQVKKAGSVHWLNYLAKPYPGGLRYSPGYCFAAEVPDDYWLTQHVRNFIMNIDANSRIACESCAPDAGWHALLFKDMSTSSIPHPCCIQHTFGVSERLFFIAGLYRQWSSLPLFLSYTTTAAMDFVLQRFNPFPQITSNEEGFPRCTHFPQLKSGYCAIKNKTRSGGIIPDHPDIRYR